MKTKTGGYPIGFREVLNWKIDFPTTLAFAVENNLEVIDLISDAAEKMPQVKSAALEIGAIDLNERTGLIAADESVRDSAVASAVSFIRKCSEESPRVFFTIMLPENPELPLKENFELMISGYEELVESLENTGSRIAVEGWPGPGCVCCTPEGYRELFKRISSKCMGVNYDPSHLIRMGIDPLKFLEEFGDRVYHVHGKDTELISENLYEYGHEIPSIFASPIRFGNQAWRYTIPGHGCTRWVEVFRILERFGYHGFVSIELEDARFNDGTGSSEKDALILAGTYLSGC